MTQRTWFVACGLGLEPAVESELHEIGAAEVVALRGGVGFRGDLRMGYRANLWLRSAIRVQEQLLDTRIHDTEDLYAAVAGLDWEQWMTPDQTLAVFASIRDAPAFSHSGYVALRTKDAIVDQFRARHGRRPSVDTHMPDLPIKLFLQGDHLRIYRDFSGVSLHKRGYRPVQVKSPLNEATAAGLLRLTGWDRASPLIDPMCGSGTFVIEAAMLAADHAPGLLRTFPFEYWIDFDAPLWETLLDEARERARSSLDFPLAGADRHPGAIGIAEESAYTARVDHLVTFRCADVRDLAPPFAPGIVVVNPPYGERIGRDDDDLLASWQELGAFLRERCAGATAWVLCGDRDLTRHLGLKTSARVPVMNGPIECRWLRYDIHAKDGLPA